MKKILSAAVLIILIFSSFPAFAEGGAAVTLDGEALTFDVEPVIVENRVLVPMRAIFEALGFRVDWQGETNSAVAVRDDRAIIAEIGSSYLYVITDTLEVVELDVAARIIGGRTMVPVRAVSEGAGCKVDWDGENKTVVISSVDKVTVKNGSELMAAIKSNTEIYLEPGEYNLTKSTAASEYVTIGSVFDGAEHIITGVENLTLVGADGVTIVVEPRYANVLNFENCSGITLKNLTLGHTVEKGHCEGGVINISDSEKVEIDDCKMYGCGTYGIIGKNSGEIKVTDSEIYECTYGIIELINCSDVIFNYSVFHDCEGFDMIALEKCRHVFFKGCKIKNNSGLWKLINVCESSDVSFMYCEFENNSAGEESSADNVLFGYCVVI